VFNHYVPVGYQDIQRLIGGVSGGIFPVVTITNEIMKNKFNLPDELLDCQWGQVTKRDLLNEITAEEMNEKYASAAFIHTVELIRLKPTNAIQQLQLVYV
jgi:hypothetical protein